MKEEESLRTYTNLLAGKKKRIAETEIKSRHPFWLFSVESPKDIKISGELESDQYTLATMQAKHDEDDVYNLDKECISKICETPINQIIFHTLEEKTARNKLKFRYPKFSLPDLAMLKELELTSGSEQDITYINDVINLFNHVHHGTELKNQEVREVLEKYDFTQPISEDNNWNIYNKLIDCVSVDDGNDENKEGDMLNVFLEGVITRTLGSSKRKISQTVKVSYLDLLVQLHKQRLDMKTFKPDQNTDLDLDSYIKSVEKEEKNKGRRKETNKPFVYDELKDPEGKVFEYDEWDFRTNTYFRRYTKVKELSSVDFYNYGGDCKTKVRKNTVLALVEDHRGLINNYKKILTSLLIEITYRKNQTDGDRFNLDKVLDYVIDKKRGVPREDVYECITKKKFDVSVLFLVDVSGSTKTLLSNNNTRVIENIAATILVLVQTFSGLLNFEIGGYSGLGPDDVRYLPLKKFKEKNTRETESNIFELAPCDENRDGAAIRHATYKLISQDTKGKVLLHISDFEPCDTQYYGSYGLSDTKMAYREALSKGVASFGIGIRGERSHLEPRSLFPNDNYILVEDTSDLSRRLIDLMFKIVKVYGV